MPTDREVSDLREALNAYKDFVGNNTAVHCGLTEMIDPVVNHTLIGLLQSMADAMDIIGQRNMLSAGNSPEVHMLVAECYITMGAVLLMQDVQTVKDRRRPHRAALHRVFTNERIRLTKSQMQAQMPGSWGGNADEVDA